ncbi:hypothetical protein PDUR_15000 [Paenibacillus durus]|uniref:Uncharacterized protein n=2 Tax=Paenibacillus durus TaxID=44251 RepID=A0A089HPR8_PAEDU|nr:hypothetical protein PDUR_15000 [Paenibacillus durus]
MAALVVQELLTQDGKFIPLTSQYGAVRSSSCFSRLHFNTQHARSSDSGIVSLMLLHLVL